MCRLMLFIVLIPSVAFAQNSSPHIKEFEQGISELRTKFEEAKRKLEEQFLAEAEKLKIEMLRGLEESRFSAMKKDDLDAAIALRDRAKQMQELEIQAEQPKPKPREAVQKPAPVVGKWLFGSIVHDFTEDGWVFLPDGKVAGIWNKRGDTYVFACVRGWANGVSNNLVVQGDAMIVDKDGVNTLRVNRLRP